MGEASVKLEPLHLKKDCSSDLEDESEEDEEDNEPAIEDSFENLRHLDMFKEPAVDVKQRSPSPPPMTVVAQIKKEKTSSDRSFLCSLCPKQFSIKSNLYRHMRTTHGTDEKMFVCSDCRGGNL